METFPSLTVTASIMIAQFCAVSKVGCHMGCRFSWLFSGYSYPMDHVGKRRRSEIMSSIRSGDTQPEKMVRSIVHRMGYRFRLHVRTLPGKPDVVLPRYKKIILVHGCFWHGHSRCLKGRPPKTNLNFWLPKLAANQKRDRAVATKLRRLGWEVLVIWQCQLRRIEKLQATLRSFLAR